ncbi:dolichyl-phosphate beta-glucosyltransferase [Ascosphaera aggregata]|nr:dolichyl-phosphate beta-glucosyltransferase [Ascosphaera aggregata]
MSVVVPAYNEEERLPGMLEEAVAYLEANYEIGYSDINNAKTSNPGTGNDAADTHTPTRRRRKIQEHIPKSDLTTTPRRNWEIIIVSDGSTDRTVETALTFTQEYQESRRARGLSGPLRDDGDDRGGGGSSSSSSIRVVSLETNRGKGGAVTHGMRHVRGQYVVFADADGASDFNDLGKLVAACQMVEDSCRRGVAVGSRAHLVGSEAVVKRSKLRNFLMHSFHLILRVLTPSATAAVKDTQCGFKLFSRNSLPYIIPFMHSEGWIFDVEMLMLAEFANIRVAEVPVGWHEVKGSKLNIIWDSLANVMQDGYLCTAHAYMQDNPHTKSTAKEKIPIALDEETFGLQMQSVPGTIISPKREYDSPKLLSDSFQSPLSPPPPPLLLPGGPRLQLYADSDSSDRNAQLLEIMKQSQLALDAQRTSIEQERVAFKEERVLWTRERECLQNRVTELERELSQLRAASSGLVTVRSGGERPNQESAGATGDEYPVWQGSSPLRRPTRTFNNSDTHDKLDPTPLSLNAALSPRAGHLRVPVELVDSSLDGIMLKSTALPADVVARVTSPSDSDSSPQNLAQTSKRAETSPEFGISDSPEKPVLNETEDCTEQDSYRSDDEITKELENILNVPTGKQPLPPTPPIPKDDTTLQEELEDGLADIPEDSCLKGPLNLRNDIRHDQAFLSVLDRKLLNEAHKILAAPPLSEDGNTEDDPSDGINPIVGNERSAKSTTESPETLGIKLKQTTNFGTVFGSLGT